MTQVLDTHGYCVIPVPGLPEIAAGDDLASLLVQALRATCGLHPGDVLVVSSKVVAKAEGRQRRAADREALIAAETVRLVARRGATSVVQIRSGVVLAAAGVDSSNVDADTVLLLPADPDHSARTLRRSLIEHFGFSPSDPLGVIVSDTAGRAWRVGQVDIALGCAGLAPVLDLRGSRDRGGRPLDATVVALADELAGAADVVRPKNAGIAAAVLRGAGLHLVDGDGPGAAALIRPAEHDWFKLGTREAIAAAAGAAPSDVALHIEQLPSGALDVLVAHDGAPAPAPQALVAAGAALASLFVSLTAEGLHPRWSAGQHDLAAHEGLTSLGVIELETT